MNCSKLTRNPLRRRLLTGAVALLAGTAGLAAHAAVYRDQGRRHRHGSTGCS